MGGITDTEWIGGGREEVGGEWKLEGIKQLVS